MSAEQLNKIRASLLAQVKQINFGKIGEYIPRKIIPPVYFLTALIIMVCLAIYAPVSYLIYVPLRIFGGVLVFTGFCISASGAYTFKLAKTPVKPFEPPVTLVTTELYRYSRNPMYLGMMIMLTGMWIALGCLSPVIVIPLFFIIIQEGFIKYEEIFLEKTFGDKYLDYKASVRRWL